MLYPALIYIAFSYFRNGSSCRTYNQIIRTFCKGRFITLASICLAIEVFGGQCVSLFALACAVSYMLSSYFSLYREQHFLHSKLRIVGVQRVHGHWSETDAAHLTTNDDGEN